MQALPCPRRGVAGTTSYVADYLTRSVRRASGFVLARHPLQSQAAAVPALTVGSELVRYNTEPAGRNGYLWRPYYDDLMESDCRSLPLPGVLNRRYLRWTRQGP